MRLTEQKNEQSAFGQIANGLAQSERTRPDDTEVSALIARMQGGDRIAAATYVELHAPLIRRRARGKLGPGLRRLVDSLDMVSTVARRLDLYVRDRRLDAQDQAGLTLLLQRIMNSAIIDKMRALERLRRAEGEDSVFAREVVMRVEGTNQGSADSMEDWVEEAMGMLASEGDRTILRLWLNDTPLFRIAEHIDGGVTPAAVRQRWRAIRERLRPLGRQREIGA